MISVDLFYFIWWSLCQLLDLYFALLVALCKRFSRPKKEKHRKTQRINEYFPSDWLGPASCWQRCRRWRWRWRRRSCDGGECEMWKAKTHSTKRKTRGWPEQRRQRFSRSLFAHRSSLHFSLFSAPLRSPLRPFIAPSVLSTGSWKCQENSNCHSCLTKGKTIILRHEENKRTENVFRGNCEFDSTHDCHLWAKLLAFVNCDYA